MRLGAITILLGRVNTRKCKTKHDFWRPYKITHDQIEPLYEYCTFWDVLAHLKTQKQILTKENFRSKKISPKTKCWSKKKSSKNVIIKCFRPKNLLGEKHDKCCRINCALTNGVWINVTGTFVSCWKWFQIYIFGQWGNSQLRYCWHWVCAVAVRWLACQGIIMLNPT